MKLKYILMCALAMIGIATQAQDDVNYDISTTPATEVVEGHMYVLQNRKYTEIGLAYDGFGATTFDPVSEQLGQFVTSVQNFFFTAGEDGFTLPVTLDNINDANIDWGYGETGGGTVLSPKRKAADNTVYFTVKDAAGQYVMLYNSTLYGVNATTPAESAQWIAYEVKEHEHKWAPNEDRTHYCTVCYVEEEEHSYVDGVCEICQHVCGHSSYYDGACEYCGAECEHNSGWEVIEGDDCWHYCTDCGYPEHHHIAEDGGACDCGFECPGHDFREDINATYEACQAAPGTIVYTCEHCQYQKTETVDPDPECPNGGQHEWEDNVYEATCTMRGYTLHRCCYCELEYISDFTDIDPNNHNWCLGYVEDEEGNLIHTNTHYCGDGCEAYGSEQEHNMVDGQCTVCGYWPGHTEHQWLTDSNGHFCTIPGCEYGGYDYHTTEEGSCACTVCGHIKHQYENGVCQNCYTRCQHKWNDGYCYICETSCEHVTEEGSCACTVCGYTEHNWNDGVCENCGTVCDHKNHWYEEARDATCINDGNKGYYVCVCDLRFADADCTEKITWEDIRIPATGHQFNEEHHCTVCDRSITIGSIITLGEQAKVNFINYCGRYNEKDPTAEPLYKIELTKAAYNFSISEELESPSIAIFDKDFNYILTVNVNEPKSLEEGIYYLLPSAYSEDEDEGGYVEFACTNVPLTITRIETFTLSTDHVTDENGNAVVLTLTDEGYETDQNIAIDDSKNFYSDIEFSVPEVTYTRDISGYAGSDWGTLCLPFDYTVADAASAGLSIYEFTAASAEAVTVTHKTEGTVKYGTPVLFKKTGEGDGATLSLTATRTKMGFDQGVIDDISGLQLCGTFEPTLVTSGYYLDATDGMLYSIEEYCRFYGCDLTIPAYRAWFDGSVSNDNEAKAFNIIIDDEEMTAIDALNAFIQGKADIYGLDGKVRSDLQKGINIVNGKKILVK